MHQNRIDGLEAKWHISRRQVANLKKIFTFYAQLHMPSTSVNASQFTFDEMNTFNKTIQQSEWLKLCKDFNLPLARSDHMEIIKRKYHREGKFNMDFEMFQELLMELLY